MSEITSKETALYVIIIFIFAWLITGGLVAYLLYLTGGSWWPMLFLLIPGSFQIRIKYNDDGEKKNEG